jgi:anaerobic selenocysteine-containing dehydrogenase
MGIETRRSFCRFCHAGCAIDVDVEVASNEIVAVRGVEDDPMYEGYTCIKGRHLGEQHQHAGRVRSSLRRTGREWSPVASATALDEIAERLAAIIATHGPNSVASYCGTASYQNATVHPVAKAFHRAIGSASFYSSLTIDQPAKMIAPMRAGSWNAGFHSFSTSNVSMIIACNTIVSAYSYPGGIPGFNPLVRLRRRKAQGLYLIVIDPRRTEAAAYADLHLQVRPGEDPTLLAGIIRVLFDEGLIDAEFCAQYVDGAEALATAVQPFTPDYVEQRAGVPAGDVIEAARQFARRGRGTVSTGTGSNMAPHPSLTEHLAMMINVLCGRVNRAGDAVPNPGGLLTAPTPIRAQVDGPWPDMLTAGRESRFRGLRTHRGEGPTAALADEILEPGDGQVRALLTIGGNPVVAWPDQHKTVAALQSLELHVCAEANMSATAKLADYVIASTLSLERPDLPTTIDRWFEEPYTMYTPAVVAKQGDLVEEWELYTELAARLGVSVKLPGGTIEPGQPVTADDILDLIYTRAKVPLDSLRAEPGGRMYPEFSTVVEAPDPTNHGRFAAAPDGITDELAEVLAEGVSGATLNGFDPQRHTFRLASRRLKSVFNSSGRELDELRTKAGTAFAHLNPDDLAALGVADGDVVELASPSHSIRAMVRSAPDVRRGAISMAHAWGGLPDEPADLAVDGSTTAALIDAESAYDPFTGIPVMSAIPIEIRVH